MYKEQINQIDLYDINIYCSGEGYLSVIAVELKEDGDNYQSNHSKTITLNIPMDEEHYDIIAYLLDTEEWQDRDWTDYDFWDTTNWLLEGDTPFMIKTWVRSLPYYTPEKVGE